VLKDGIGSSGQAPSLASRAALSRAKSSPAWWEERVRGVADTRVKPLA
jgi:hypothetical protein